MDAASYYSDLTALYRHYGGAAHAWHYGVWEPDVGDHQQALLRSNELLLRGLEPDSETRILDLGFGGGGFAVWAAGRYGCRVTGITVCADHLAVARDLARSRGVADRCRFLLMDMDHLSFSDRWFDVVVNQDTFCHSAAKAAMLPQVHRVLRPGGRWRAIDFSIQAEPLTRRQERHYRAVREGFHIPSLASEKEVLGMLREADFTAIRSRDLTGQVLKTATLIQRQCYLPRLMARLHLDWIVYSLDRERRRNRRGHVSAALAYSRGLLGGTFRHCFYSARRAG